MQRADDSIAEWSSGAYRTGGGSRTRQWDEIGAWTRRLFVFVMIHKAVHERRRGRTEM